jgi:hypothetical protein
MIFEAIAAIKIANEAIGAIKEFAGHVESVGQMGKDLTKLADAKDELQKSAADGDMEAFWALEDIKRHEAEVKQMFIYNGRPGLWDDYCRFIENRKTLVKTSVNVQKLRNWLAKKPLRMDLFMVLLAFLCSVLWAGPWPYYCGLLVIKVVNE